MAGRRGDFYYVGLIAVVVALGWLGLQLFGRGSGRPFEDSQLAALFRDIELPPIELVPLDFGFLSPSPRKGPQRAQVRWADEMELALVQNRNQLLQTASPATLPIE